MKKKTFFLSFALSLLFVLTLLPGAAFADSTELACVYIPASVTEIALDAFENVTGLTIVGAADSAAESFAEAKGFRFVTETVHVHSWSPVYQTVHHDAVTEEVWVVDQEAWDEPLRFYGIMESKYPA